MTRMHVAHMRVAYVYAELSYAQRRKVGCVIVKDGAVIAIGYNGTPPGWDNTCEDDDGNTKAEVVHAEQNALDKLIRSGVSSKGAAVYITTMPCIDCAKRLIGATVESVYYAEKYRNDAGITLLHKAGIPTGQVNI